MDAVRARMAKKASNVGVSTSEWMCKKHGFQPAPKSTKDPKCKWCNGPLTLNTWTMSGG